ncbi:hypothetical protein EUTSA_v10011925mg [Eutrema salsugineum]|uniref:Uncharacterized protein n=1 Tax=Eutrema salsugineum TaxID=72664 RepID=V4KGE2_EUTSA|nr:hypothetical protein EUTSA_v10011925mg [Eutrema salsugineum]
MGLPIYMLSIFDIIKLDVSYTFRTTSYIYFCKTFMVCSIVPLLASIYSYRIQSSWRSPCEVCSKRAE